MHSVVGMNEYSLCLVFKEESNDLQEDTECVQRQINRYMLKDFLNRN